MLNLIRCDFYKLRKAKYSFICLIIAVLLAVGTVFLLDFSYKLAGDQMAQSVELSQENMQEAGVSISAEGLVTNYEDLSASSQVLLFLGGNINILMAVIVSLFVGSEFNQGTIKNLASRNYSRSKIYMSKFIVSVVTAIFFSLVYVLVSTAAATALWGFGDVSGSYWLELLGYGSIQLLLAASYASVFVMFSILIRQNGGSLAANICFLEFLSLIASLLEMLIKHITDKSVALSVYLPDINMVAMAQDPTTKVVIRALCVGIGFLVVPALLGLWNFSKRDIK